MKDYSDIINLPHHISIKHPHMSMQMRAAQFAPFAALTGHDAAVREAARLTDERMDMEEEFKLKLDSKLEFLRLNLHESPQVVITYFVKDSRKAGGRYETRGGKLIKIRDFEKTLVLDDKTEIPIVDIISIDGDVFRGLMSLE